MSAQRNLNDTELLSAYIDGQLTIEERSALEARLLDDADLRQQLALLRATVDLIKELPQLQAPRNFTLTRRMVSSGGSSRRIYAFSLLSAAAAIVLLFVGFGLLSAGSENVVGSLLSRVANNLEPDDELSQIVLVPTDTLYSTRELATPSAETGFFATGEQIGESADLESESGAEEVQEEPSILSQLFLTATQAPPAAQGGTTFGADGDTSDTTTTTLEESTQDERFRDTQQAQTQSESAPAPAVPFDSLAEPSQDAAGGMLAFQATTAPPTSTTQPTMLPTRTALPTQTASDTAARTPTQTILPQATSRPVAPPAPTSVTEPMDLLAVVLIVIAVILLVAAASAVILNRRR